MDFKFVFLIIVLSISLGWSQPTLAQQYIDIDLAPPTKPKQAPPKPQPAQPIAKKPTPKLPPKPPSIPTPRPTQKPVARPAAPTQQQIAPVARPAPPRPPIKTAAPAVRKPAPTATQVPVPAAPTQRPVAIPTPPQPAPKAETASSAGGRNSVDIIGDPTGKFKNRHGFTVDYTTWYETMKLTNLATKALVEGTSHYFGVSFNYDFTVYRERWGYALNVGAVTGNAQAGTKDSGDYYERRIVWTGFRGGARLFWRANNRIDLGLGFLAQSKSTKWPEEENYVVVPQANPHYFYYLDTRWRLNYRYELVQSFGTHLRSYALAWMLGLTYTLN
jgi:hypothetical protein